MNIYKLPKEIQKYILEYISYPYNVQKKELLEDIRDFVESYDYLYEIFYTKTLESNVTIMDDSEFEYHVYYTIYYNILTELDHPKFTCLGIYTNYFYSVLLRLYAFNYNWFLQYQYDDVDVDVDNPCIHVLKNKIRFLFGIMNKHERFNMLFYHYNEDNIEYDDYDG
jgi:hypothetical protein